MPTAPPFLLGVNYWPRTQAMSFWSQFDASIVAEDFATLRELGLSSVRLFLLWEDFQPQSYTIDERALSNLETTLGLAERNGLTLNVTFFTGHMSGPNWIPSWMLEGPPSPRVNQVVSSGRVVQSGCKNPFADEDVIQAAQHLVRTVVERFKDHPGVGCWNLGNEPDLVAWPPSDEAGRVWTARMAETIRGTGAREPIGMGLHVASLIQNVHLRVDQVFGELDFASMHAYPMYGDLSEGPLDPDFVPFCCALTSALSGKATLMEEFGGCTNVPGRPSETWSFSAFGQPREQFMASEEDLADHLAAVLPKLVEVGATGALLWCFADYPQDLWHRPPCDHAIHERFFGLVRGDGSLKPHAEVLRRFAQSEPVVQSASRTVTLDVTADEYYERPTEHLRRLYEVYRRNAED